MRGTFSVPAGTQLGFRRRIIVGPHRIIIGEDASLYGT
jgi:hypothetical protein